MVQSIEIQKSKKKAKPIKIRFAFYTFFYELLNIIKY